MQTSIRFAFARSDVRRDVLLSLAAIGPSYAAEISKATGRGVAHVVGALVGREGDYRSDLSLVGLGFARELSHNRPGPRVFAVTEIGAALATSFRAPPAAQGAQK